MNHRLLQLGAILRIAACIAVMSGAVAHAMQQDHVQPYKENHRYWQYDGRPTVLLGGSKDDNLFQIPDLEEHLKLLASVGGNYVRNTMSSRDPGNVQPFARLPDGRYDLERWDDEYWRRFESLLRWSRELGIVVQIEVWDRFDYSGEQWLITAFNPKNNVNYTYKESDFVEEYPEHPGANRQPFFFTTPKQRNNAVVLRYQKRFVDELLRRSLRYPNVLYCIDNETSGDAAWSAYWADYIHDRARKAGARVYVTEMWDEWDLRAPQHRRTLDHPQRYGFLDVSQNNHQRGEAHWRNFHWVRNYVSAKPRPINTVKTYGADADAGPKDIRSWWKRALGHAATTNTAGDYGTTQHGTERWWRHLIGGAAAVRFHRPPSGIGLNHVAQQHIRSARMLLEEFDLVRATPDPLHRLLSGRGENEAYATHIEDRAYAVYFPDGGALDLTLPVAAEFSVRWLDVSAGRWLSQSSEPAGNRVPLRAPGRGHWVALVKKVAPR